MISKRGRAPLRYALCQAALVASTRNAAFRTLFYGWLEGRQREPGIKTKLRVKLAAKLLVIAWTMLKRGEGFDASRLTS